MEGIIQGPRPSSRTVSSSIDQGGTGRALPESHKITYARLHVHISRQTASKRLHLDDMEVPCPQVEVLLTAQTSQTAREHWHIHWWHHVLFSDESRFTMRSCDKCERVCEELLHNLGGTSMYPEEPLLLSIVRRYTSIHLMHDNTQSACGWSVSVVPGWMLLLTDPTPHLSHTFPQINL